MRQRQYADERTILFSQDIMTVMAKGRFDHARPGGAMEKRGGGMPGDERIPGGSTGLIEQSQSDCHAALRGNAQSACRVCNIVSEHTIHPAPREIVQQPIQSSGHM